MRGLSAVQASKAQLEVSPARNNHETTMKSERVARSAVWSGREDLAYRPAASLTVCQTTCLSHWWHLSARPDCEPHGRASLVWSGREDSNLRPLRPERSALPGCATPRQNNRHEEPRLSYIRGGETQAMGVGHRLTGNRAVYQVDSFGQTASARMASSTPCEARRTIRKRGIRQGDVDVCGTIPAYSDTQ